jgi:hypothetical protein
VPYALLRDARSIGGSISKCKADSLFADFFFRNDFFPRSAQNFLQFRIGLNIAQKLPSVGHWLVPHFASVASASVAYAPGYRLHPV